MSDVNMRITSVFYPPTFTIIEGKSRRVLCVFSATTKPIAAHCHMHDIHDNTEIQGFITASGYTKNSTNKFSWKIVQETGPFFYVLNCS